MNDRSKEDLRKLIYTFPWYSQQCCGSTLLRCSSVPLGLADLFEDIDEHDFRVDVSSTELRAQAMRQEPLGARPSGASRVE
eukprot:scaffold29545_cov19-Tisochrysis_lutea.AAC.2